jgi:hypothetical protein
MLIYSAIASLDGYTADSEGKFDARSCTSSTSARRMTAA